MQEATTAKFMFFRRGLLSAEITPRVARYVMIMSGPEAAVQKV